jgi:hypothetical protein
MEKAGLKVYGADGSEKMLEICRINLLNFFHSDFLSLFTPASILEIHDRSG